jgi:cytochrome c peroxidase
MRRSVLTITILVGFCQVLSWLISACTKEHPHTSLSKLALEIPEGFPQPAYDFSDNPLTKEGFELGRNLFYDGRLSIDNEHSCASCHQQIAAFGTFEHDRSHGVNGTHTLRNAPGLFNLAWSNSFHWDGEFASLYEEALHPLHGSSEMGETLQGIIRKLEADEEYREEFKKLFRYPIIRPEYVLKALAQFTGTLVSANSKYDRYKKGLVSFFPPEEAGYVVFKAKCATCHPEPLFTDFSYRNIGLPVDNFLNDFGRMRVTGRSEDSLKFKVPTLRNVGISSNYMHDGRFATTQQCINHYRNNVQPGPTVDPLVVGGISMTDAEASNLAAFLRTLTDSSFITDPRLAEPPR